MSAIQHLINRALLVQGLEDRLALYFSTSLSMMRRQVRQASFRVGRGLSQRSNEVNRDMPPLPIIREEAIAGKVFTHRSVAKRLAHQFEDSPDDPSPDNEK